MIKWTVNSFLACVNIYSIFSKPSCSALTPDFVNTNKYINKYQNHKIDMWIINTKYLDNKLSYYLNALLYPNPNKWNKSLYI